MLKTPSLVGYWPFEGDAVDVSGNGYNGTVSGATLATGKFGQCYDFVPGQGISTPAAVRDGPNAANLLTIAMWASNRATTFPSTYRMMWGFAGQGTYLALRTATLIPFFSINTSGGQKTVAAPAGITTTTWTHIAATWDGAAMRIYVNGSLVVTQSYAGVTLAIPAVALAMIGNWSATNYGWDGQIDDLMIFKKALPDSDVKRIMLGMHPLG